MPLDIVLEDENGKSILAIDDSQGSLSQLVKYCSHRMNEFRVMKYIDLYGDTTFNTLMIQDLVIDLQKIAGDFPSMDDHKTALINQLKAMCSDALEEPHQYIKVYGD